MTTETKSEFSGDILLKDVVLDWPNLFKPGGREGDTPRYGATFNMPPDHPQVAQIRKVIQQACVAKWKDKAKEMHALLNKKDLVPLRDGDDKVIKYPYLAGMLFLATASPAGKPRPTTFDGARREVDENAGLFYRGAIVNAKISIWAQDNAYGQRVNAQLMGVQFVRKGEPLGGGGRTASADEFEAIAAPEETGSDDWA